MRSSKRSFTPEQFPEHICRETHVYTVLEREETEEGDDECTAEKIGRMVGVVVLSSNHTTTLAHAHAHMGPPRSHLPQGTRLDVAGASSTSHHIVLFAPEKERASDILF